MYFDETNNYFDIISYDKEFNIDKSNYDYDYNNINVNIDNINFNRDVELYTTIEGFNKGNMFPNLYSNYKNHIYKLKVNNEKDETLYKIQMYSFALKDYNLYLDLYPNDTKILREFRTIKKMYEEEKNKYESKYGPICITGVESTSKWTWIDNPWPWDKGGNK